MPKFKVHVTRDASVTYSAMVEADSLEQVKEHMSRHGYAGPVIGGDEAWECEAVNTYDEVEQYQVYDENGDELYEENRSW